jgi:segregation and condensation protein B
MRQQQPRKMHPLMPRRFPPPMHRSRWLQGSRNTVQAAPHPLARSPELARIEAALFASDEPLTPRKLATLAGLPEISEVRSLVAQLAALYEAEGSAFTVEEIAGGYQLLTRPEYYNWLARLRRQQTTASLSAAARETLTIIAYRQPLTRADIEAIRGVHCGELLRILLERGLIKLAGREDSLGRPVLYETTKKFLQWFGLRSLKDLPQAEGLSLPAAPVAPSGRKQAIQQDQQTKHDQAHDPTENPGRRGDAGVG